MEQGVLPILTTTLPHFSSVAYFKAHFESAFIVFNFQLMFPYLDSSVLCRAQGTCTSTVGITADRITWREWAIQLICFWELGLAYANACFLLPWCQRPCRKASPDLLSWSLFTSCKTEEFLEKHGVPDSISQKRTSVRIVCTLETGFCHENSSA